MGEPESLKAFGGLMECRDIGYLVGNNRQSVTLAVSISVEDNSFRHSNTIPRGWVRRITHLARPPETEAIPSVPPVD